MFHLLIAGGLYTHNILVENAAKDLQRRINDKYVYPIFQCTLMNTAEVSLYFSTWGEYEYNIQSTNFIEAP